MLYIVILIVAVAAIAFFVMKKRGQANTSTQKPAAKKPVAPSSSTPAQAPVETKKAFTPLAPEIRNKIEALIQEQNYFAAEAQINQALNRDNTQHELYLLLLDIHIAQKDEFAIDQLLNHLKGLELADILQQAEAKKAEYNKKDVDAIEFSPVNAAPKIQEAPTPVEPASQPSITDTAAFDQLHSAPEVQAPEPPKEDIAPLDFNFSSTTTEPVVAEKVEEHKAEEINFASFDELSLTPDTTEKVEPVKEEPAPLDFNFTLEPTTEVVEETAPEVISTEDKVAEPSLDFSFTEVSTQPSTEPAIALSVEEPQLTVESIETEAPVIAPAKAEEPNLDFDLTAPAKPLGTSFNLEQAVPPAPVDTTDPLAQSFPELIETNEITLNLDLAQQYIELGAFEAARQLLTEKDAEYSADQRQRADELRNQIA